MAETKLVLKVDATKDEIFVFDKTGVYSSQNTGGWGLPNNVISDVSTAVVRVYLPKSSTYISVNVASVLPNTTGVGFQIVPSDLSLSSFPPGIYKLQYYITMNDGTILSQIVYYFHYQSLECCISKKKKKTSLDDATSQLSLEVLELETLLENAIWAACSGDRNSAEEIADYIWTKCNCCC